MLRQIWAYSYLIGWCVKPTRLKQSRLSKLFPFVVHLQLHRAQKRIVYIKTVKNFVKTQYKQFYLGLLHHPNHTIIDNPPRDWCCDLLV